METNKKSVKQIKNGDKLKISLYVLVVLLLALISFGGIYVQKTNKMKNKLPEYILGTDLYGYREVIIKPGETTKNNDYEVEIIDENGEKTETESEEKNNDLENEDNYLKVKQLIKERLEYAKVNYYEIKCNETDGTINIKLPEKSGTDTIAQYCITKGEFKMADSETGEVFLNNEHVKKAGVQYASTSTGTAIFLTIELNKEGTEKLKEISNIYVESEDEEGNDTSKKIKMTIDDSEMITSSFEKEISDGKIELSLGTSSDLTTLQKNIAQGNNIALLLNNGPMPITYKMEENRFIKSSITLSSILIIAGCVGTIYLIMLVYMAIKYKKQGILLGIACIGFVSILLIAVRIFNVPITITGISTIILSCIIEYSLFMQILNEYSKKIDKEIKNKEIKNIIKDQMQYSIPLIIIAIVFALAKWEPMYSIGMNLFWAIVIIAIWNYIILKFIFKSKEN